MHAGFVKHLCFIVAVCVWPLSASALAQTQDTMWRSQLDAHNWTRPSDPRVRIAKLQEALANDAKARGGDSLLDDDFSLTGTCWTMICSATNDLLGGPDLLGGQSDDDPLSNLGPTKKIKDTGAKGKDPHEDLWTEDCYPSAETCRKCHPAQYEQWRASGHAYASVSPMFNRFEQAMTEYTQGTVG